MNQTVILVVHVGIFLTVLILSALVSCPMRLFFPAKNNVSKDANGLVYGYSDTALITEQEIDFRAIKKCPYNDYSQFLRNLHLDSYDENCQSFVEKKPDVKKNLSLMPQVRIIRRVVIREICFPVKKKGILQNKCKNMSIIEAVPENESDECVRKEDHPYVTEIVLKVILLGLLFNALLDSFNHHWNRLETAGANNQTPVRRRRSSTYNNFPRPRYNYNGSYLQSNGHAICSPPTNRNNYNNTYGSLGARPSTLVRRSSCPTNTLNMHDPYYMYDGSPRNFRRNTLIFRRR